MGKCSLVRMLAQNIVWRLGKVVSYWGPLPLLLRGCICPWTLVLTESPQTLQHANRCSRSHCSGGRPCNSPERCWSTCVLKPATVFQPGRAPLAWRQHPTIGQVWWLDPCSLSNNSSGERSSPKSARNSSSVIGSLGWGGLGGCGLWEIPRAAEDYAYVIPWSTNVS